MSADGIELNTKLLLLGEQFAGGICIISFLDNVRIFKINSTQPYVD